VIEMIEIGAGGGSLVSVDRMGQIRVGPESAGADPGPVAFGKGGTTATVTDADVTLGYIDPARFAEGRLSIDRPAAEAALARGRARPWASTPPRPPSASATSSTKHGRRGPDARRGIGQGPGNG
jgi:N-methylhydantoinase A